MGFIDLESLPELQPKTGWHGRFFHSEHMTFAYYLIDEGATLPAHAHANEEVWHVIEGSIDLTLDDQTRTVLAGNAVVVPPNTLHVAKARERCRAIVVDHPVRREVAGLQI
ncbi:MAG TPA: cupin domain-containing protein [Candidatus Baltobacteraceae bacterium]|nr:cupin domain-containing protein [Candidatus Baltobacteraceae bacterium]